MPLRPCHPYMSSPSASSRDKEDTPDTPLCGVPLTKDFVIMAEQMFPALALMALVAESDNAIRCFAW